jgi:hypothetical protein
MARSGSQERTKGTSQQAQGRLKEAIGALTGNRRQARQGPRRSRPRPAARALGAPQGRSAPLEAPAATTSPAGPPPAVFYNQRLAAEPRRRRSPTQPTARPRSSNRSASRSSPRSKPARPLEPARRALPRRVRPRLRGKRGRERRTEPYDAYTDRTSALASCTRTAHETAQNHGSSASPPPQRRRRPEPRLPHAGGSTRLDRSVLHLRPLTDLLGAAAFNVELGE